VRALAIGLALASSSSEDGGFPAGDGYFVAVAGRELLGARYLGLTIGYSIDVATGPRRWPRPL
jgi:hypothetical protein